MADKKQLVLAVEGNAAIGPYWRTIFSDYLEKLIRSFCGNKAREDASPNVLLALVQFNAHGSHSPFLVQRSAWTRNVDSFLGWLSDIHISGGGFDDAAAVAEGLTEVLMMLHSPNLNETQQNEGLQRHCILVAASNPHPLPTRVYLPPDKSETKSESCLSYAETVAKSFPQCFVSLSVICPMQLHKLESIYNAGKRSPSAVDYTIDIVKNPYYLVLISEELMKACADLSHSVVTSLPSYPSRKVMKFTSVSPVSEPPSTSVGPGLDPSVVNWIQPAEPMTVSSTASTQTYENVSPLSCSWPPSMSVAAGFEPDELNCILSVDPMTVSLVASTQTYENVSPLFSSEPPSTSVAPGLGPDVLNWIQSAEPLTVSSTGSTHTFENVSPLSCSTSQEVSSQQTFSPLSTSQKIRSSKEHLQYLKPGASVLRPGRPSTGTMMPPPGTSQQVQAASALQSQQPKYVKVWEGDLSFMKHDEIVFITRLEAYRESTSSELLAADWPSTMLIDRLITQDEVEVNNKQYDGKLDFVYFAAKNQPAYFVQANKKKLNMLIRLPSQALLLSVPNKPTRLLGIVFPLENVVFAPRTSENQQPPPPLLPPSQQQQQQVGHWYYLD